MDAPHHSRTWLDGFSVGKGLIRQFVAMPLGEGYTAEEQLTGEGRRGGVQLVVCPMLASRYEDSKREEGAPDHDGIVCSAPASEMGLAPGVSCARKSARTTMASTPGTARCAPRCFVQVLDSAQCLEVAGVAPPAKPPTARDCTEAGLPWFEYYDGDRAALDGAAKLAGLDSLAAKRLKQGKGPLPDNEAVEPAVIRKPGPAQVREGEF